eukprot:Nk52_evm16s418 gene=Nk52_evmTU16s418
MPTSSSSAYSSNVGPYNFLSEDLNDMKRQLMMLNKNIKLMTENHHVETPEVKADKDSSTSSIDCTRSKRDSLGKFCFADEYWDVVRSIALRQRSINYYPTNMRFKGAFKFFQTVWEPEMSCLTEERIGMPGDGGKWLCDPRRLLNAEKNCLVYSFGSNNKFDYEIYMHHFFPNCEIHTFDHTVENPDVPDFVNYHYWGVSPIDQPPQPKPRGFFARLFGIGETHAIDAPVQHVDTEEGESDFNGTLLKGQLYSLPTIQKELGHVGRTVQVLKMDVEGAEFQAFAPYFRHGGSEMLFDQILLEVHTADNLNAYQETHKFFKDITTHGDYGKYGDKYVFLKQALTHKEPNIEAGSSCCVEYAFVKMSPLFLGKDYLGLSNSDVAKLHPEV